MEVEIIDVIQDDMEVEIIDVIQDESNKENIPTSRFPNVDLDAEESLLPLRHRLAISMAAATKNKTVNKILQDMDNWFE